MPYCPACKLERLDETPICPIDGRYYRIERCPRCAGEMAPSETFCIHCGQRPDRRVREVIALQPASLTARGLALCIDLLCVTYLAEALPRAFHHESMSGLLLLAPLALLYFALCGWNARRTVGQQVLGLVALGRDRGPLPLGRSLMRAAVLVVSLAVLTVPLFLSLKSRGRLLHDVVADAEVFRL